MAVSGEADDAIFWVVCVRAKGSECRPHPSWPFCTFERFHIWSYFVLWVLLLHLGFAWTGSQNYNVQWCPAISFLPFNHGSPNGNEKNKSLWFWAGFLSASKVLELEISPQTIFMPSETSSQNFHLIQLPAFFPAMLGDWCCIHCGLSRYVYCGTLGFQQVVACLRVITVAPRPSCV